VTVDAPTRTVGLVGARGYTGAEMVRLIEAHPQLELAMVCSRGRAGERLAEHVEGARSELRFEDADPAQVAASGVDAVVLALPNGVSAPFVDAIGARGRETVIIDLSADHRFEEAGRWVYGLPEHFRDSIRGARRIANPGCYATGMQIAIRPLLDILSGPPHVFGVSGYSGAGTTPSDRNDPEKLRDNLMPYALTGHVHEREVSRHLGRPVRFHPHVAPFFRGITLTVSMSLAEPQTWDNLAERYHRAYDDEPLVRFNTEPPLVREIAQLHECALGGLTVDDATGRHAVIVATLDNLLKGAATQAIQNINLACGLDEYAGILSRTAKAG